MTLLSEGELRRCVVDVCRRMHDAGLIAALDGNVSARLGSGSLLMTPSGRNKGFLSQEDLLVTDMRGAPRRRGGKPSSESRMHAAVYALRPDVGAVVHAHPPNAVAASIARISLARCILPETILSLGTIPTSEYATPTTDEVPPVVEKYLRDHDAVLLDRHGTVTVGNTLQQAFDRLEAVEHTALITLLAARLGPLDPLPEAEVVKLRRMAADLGVRAAFPGCGDCSVCSRASVQAAPDSRIVEEIASRVLKRL